MSEPLVFIDTETTGLDPDTHEVWEVGMVVRAGGTETEHHWFVQVDLKAANPEALDIGGFHDRYDTREAVAPLDLAGGLHTLIPPRAHLVGAVVSFDEERLRRLMNRYRVPVRWHYHLVDVENLVAGRLGIEPPWESDDLAAALGVTIDEKDRHTALGDARWAMRLYDAALLGATSETA